MTDLLHIREASTGRVIAYQVPSTSEPGLFHTVRPTWCSCKGFAYRGHCRHQREVVEYVEAHRPPMPASAVIDGLTQMASARYADIFKRFEGD